MLNRSYYDDNFACDLMEMYTALDTSIIEAMARRIAHMGRVSDYTRWQAETLQEAGLLYEDIIRLIGEQTGMSDAYLQQIFEDAAVESVSFDNTIYEAAGLEIVPLRQSPSMMNLLRAGLKKTGGSLRNLTMTTANTAQTAYISACNLAYMQVSSGAMSYTEAIRAAVKSSAKQGTKVLYPSGHQDQLDVAIRRSVLTGVSQTSAVIGMENARLMGCDLMEITAHAGARPEHAAWQGKIVSLSGRKGYLTLADIGYGSVTGFKGANCRHDWYPFFEGISTRLYSDRQLEELAKSDLYDLQQGQRAMERQIRATRRELAGYDAAMSAADPDTAAAIRNDFDEAAVKLKKQEAALREYCRSNGLLEDSSRVQTLYGDGTTQGFGRSTSQKAVWANKRLTTAKENAILDVEKRIGTDEFPLILNVGNQNKHISTSHSYNAAARKSVLFGDLDTARELFNRYHGSGEYRFTSELVWTKKEFVVADEEIGVTFDLDTGEGSVTNRFAIHFGKKGWHIVPVKRKKD